MGHPRRIGPPAGGMSAVPTELMRNSNLSPCALCGRLRVGKSFLAGRWCGASNVGGGINDVAPPALI